MKEHACPSREQELVLCVHCLRAGLFFAWNSVWTAASAFLSQLDELLPLLLPRALPSYS